MKSGTTFTDHDLLERIANASERTARNTFLIRAPDDLRDHNRDPRRNWSDMHFLPPG